MGEPHVTFVPFSRGWSAGQVKRKSYEGQAGNARFASYGHISVLLRVVFMGASILHHIHFIVLYEALLLSGMLAQWCGIVNALKMIMSEIARYREHCPAVRAASLES